MANDNDIIAKLKVEGLSQFKVEMSQSSKAVDSTTVSINKMEKAITEATNPKDIQRLTKELEAIKIASDAGATAFESSKAKLKAYKEEATGLAIVLATLKSEGKQNTQTFKDIEKQFESTKRKAGDLSDQIGDINQEIKSLGSDTRGIDNVVRGATLMANGFQLATGVQALLGKENKALSEGLLKLNGIMAVTQSIQQIGNELTREDSIVKQAATKATALYNLVVGQSTGALKFFRLALAATGIGLAVVAIGLLIANWDKLTASINKGKISLEDYKKIQEEMQLSDEKKLKDLDTELKYRIAIGEITEKEAKKRMLLAESVQVEKASNELKKQLKVLEDIKNIDTSKKFVGIYVVTPGQKDEKLLNQTKIVEAANLRLKELTTSLINTTNDLTKSSDKKTVSVSKLKKETDKVTDSIDELDIKGIQYGLNSEKYLQEQIALYTELRSTLDIGTESYIALGEVIDAFKNKLAGKQKVEPIDFSDALKGLPTKGTDKKIPSFWDTYFGDKATQLSRAEGAKKIIEDINSYGVQISNIAEQAIQIRASNELTALEEKRDKGIITEKEYEKKSAEIKNEAARKKRAIDIANATAQIPVAVLSAYIAGMQIGGVAAPIVAGVLAGVAGAFGIAQVALIAAAPLPKFRDGGSVAKRLGLIKGKKHEQGGVPIEVEGDEFVVKSQATKKYGVKMLDDINNLRFNPILSANKKLKTQSNDLRLYENLATISSYLKQGYKVDANGNQILKEISNKLNNKSVYV